MSPLTTNGLTIAAVEAQPEFADHRTAKLLFGLSRATLYRLAKDHTIRTALIRCTGRVSGRRLFDCASIRKYICSQMEGGETK